MQKAIVAHMRTIAHMLLVDSYCTNINTDIETYITSTRMDQRAVYGTQAEMLTFSHLVKSNV